MAALFALFGLFCGQAPAQSVPALINYQGQLTDANGTDLATADYTLTFRIYGSEAGTDLIWGPQVFDGAGGQGHGAKVPVVHGFFNVLLGQWDTAGRSLATAFDGTDRYVEVQLGGNAAIKPRQRILTAPFAFKAVNAEKLAGYDWASLLSVNDPVNGKLAGAKIATDSLTATQIANDAIGNGELQNNAVSTAKLQDGSVVNTKLADNSVNNRTLQANAVSTAVMADGQVTSPKIADGAVLSSKIADGQVVTAKLADGSVTSAKIATSAVTLDKLQDRSISSTKVQVGGLLLENLASEVAYRLVPTGAVEAFAGSTPPAGWLLCDGSAVGRTGTYAALYAAIGTSWGGGNGSTTFNVPDLRGVFLRGVNGSRTGQYADPGDGRSGSGVGSFQTDQYGSHQHATSAYNSRSPWGNEANAGNEPIDTYAGEDRSVPKSLTRQSGGSETRPKNAYVNYIIKY